MNIWEDITMTTQTIVIISLVTVAVVYGLYKLASYVIKSEKKKAIRAERLRITGYIFNKSDFYWDIVPPTEEARIKARTLEELAWLLVKEGLLP